MVKKEENFLEYIPVRNEEFEFEQDEQGQITILKENKGLMNKIFQVLFKKPKVSYIHLDEMGNFIWPLMDGQRNILEISEYVKAEFGEKAEPLYERLVKYLKILESYSFISINANPFNS